LSRRLRDVELSAIGPKTLGSMMPKTESAAEPVVLAKRGTKHTCRNDACLSRFYDLHRVPAFCPSCGSLCEMPATVNFNFETLGKHRSRKFIRLTQMQTPPVVISEIDGAPVDAKAEEETEIPSATDGLLIEMDDDDTN
jgi:hypothetical protein